MLPRWTPWGQLPPEFNSKEIFPTIKKIRKVSKKSIKSHRKINNSYFQAPKTTLDGQNEAQDPDQVIIQKQPEPERIGKPYNQWAQEQREKTQTDAQKPSQKLIQRKERELEQEVLQSQIIDKQTPYQIDPEAQLLRDRETKINIAQFNLAKPEEFYFQPGESREYGVFDFMDITLAEKPGFILIEGVYEEGFHAGGVDFKGSVIAFNKQIFTWDVANYDDIRPHTFDLIKYVKPRPSKQNFTFWKNSIFWIFFDFLNFFELLKNFWAKSLWGYILIGTGKEDRPIPHHYFNELRELGIKVDSCSTFKAVSSHNFCVENSVAICSFLIPDV